MASLSLRISVAGASSNVVKTIQFDPQTIVYDACRIIREKFNEAPDGNPGDYGLFLADEDPRKGVWLEAGRPLEYYLLRNQDLLEYKKKIRVLRVRMLDGAVKTLHVDDSHTVGQLMITICSKIGIAHHEEYSLVRDLTADEKEKTLTLKRDRSIAKDQKKLDEMKRKLHTDDELDWLDHGKTLREQGVTVEETLLLRRKYFFSDQNVDARDPVQLNLLYVQMRDAIIKGAHPVTLEEAITFAAIQCQVQFGDHNESKHKSGFLDLKEFLPKEYVKTKGIEKKIFGEHKNITNLAIDKHSMSEVEAKVKYTQVARSLKTYGITFFLVKEKMKGKNKLVPRLLGITKESVVRVDEKTKEILKRWPLTQVRRWAASPNSFTLDFGDYSDSYYSVQTTEGEQISQLIAGYIDIILKKQKAKDHLGIDGDEESTMYEDSVSPARATIIQHQSAKVGHANVDSLAMPAVMRAGGEGLQSAMTAGSLQKAQLSDLSMQAHAGYAASPGQNSEIWGLKPAQRGLLGTMESGSRAVKDAEDELGKREEVPVGNDPGSQQWRENNRDLSKQKVGSQLSAMNAATAQIVTGTSGDPEDTDYTVVGSAVQNIQSNIVEFSRDIRLLAALQEDQSDGDKLLDAARKLASAFSDLLNAAQPGSKEPRQNVLAAASRVGEAGHDIMIRVTDYETEQDRAFEDKLLTLAKAVANATAVLVLKAKGVASKCDNQPDQNSVISSATQCALSTSQLVACTKVVAPTIQNPSCQEQLAEAARQVARSVDHVADTAQSVCRDDGALNELGESAGAVQSALNDLLAHIKRGMASGQELDEVDNILTATERLYSTTEDPSEMIRQAKLLAQATSQLVAALTLEAESKRDSEEQRKLLAAAKVLADATSRMVEAAKGCAGSPHSKDQQQQLRVAAEDLREATTVALGVSLKRQVIRRLERAARNAASAATQLINASRGATPSNRNQASQHQLIMQCKVVGDESIPRLVRGIKGTINDPDNLAAHLTLISAAQDMLQPGGDLVSLSKAAIPTVGDQSASLSLSNAAKNLAAALSELRAASTRAQETCQSLEIDGALNQLHLLQQELEDMRRAVATGNLIPMPGDTAEEAAAQLGASSKTVGSSMAQLLTAAAQGDENYTGAAARDTANALRVFANAVRAVAATNGDHEFQAQIIACCQDVIDKSTALIDEAKRAVANPNDPDNQQRLALVAKAASQALNNCINCLPGLHEIDSSLRLVGSVSQRLAGNQFPSSGRNFQDVQNQLNSRAASLNQAASDIVSVSSHGPPQQLAATSTRFGREFETFMDTGLEMIGVTREQEMKVQVIGGLRGVSMTSTKLLMSSKSLLADPNAPNMKNQLQLAARAVTESINALLVVCTVSAPGQKECDNALRQMQAVRPLLDNPSEPLSDASYFECLDTVIEKSRALADTMTGISNHAKRAEMEQFCDNVRNFANNVCGLTENAAQAAYLVGIADPASEPGRAGLIDQSLFARASQAIQAACESLTSTSNAQQQDFHGVVLLAASTVGKQTTALCNACRVASSTTNNPVAKRHFVQSAKDVAVSTANLVRAIKTLDGQFTEENRQRCAEAARPLLQAVDELTMFASSPEFASVLAKIGPQARSAQEPITSAGRALIDGACSMVLAAKQLAVTPKDPPTYQQYSAHSHTVSEAIKRMVTALRENAPGQRECDVALERMNNSIHEVDQASLAAVSQNLVPRGECSMQGYQEQMVNSARQLVDIMNALKPVAKREAEKLGHLVSQVASFNESLVQGAVGYASKTLNSKRQMNILDQTKTVAESALQLLYVVKQAGGNPKSTQTHATVDEAVEAAKEMLNELIQMLDELASADGIVTNMIDVISKAIDRTEERILVPDSVSYVDFQTSMVRLAKQIAKHAQDMVSKSNTSPGELGNLCGLLARDYDKLASETKGALATTPSQESGNRLKSAVQDLGTTCIELVKDAGVLQANPADTFSKKDVSLHARKVGEKVANVLSALQSGARGTQACINAASTISGIVADLDTTIMFASAGTLHAEPNETFGDHRESILKTAKALVEDTKTLVAGAASNQEQLASAAQNAVMTITKLAECVKHGASSLGSEQSEAQVMLINAIKDVTTALADLIEATKNASGKPSTDPAMGTLKEAAKTMVTNVTSLLKTVKTVEDETSRGTQALESSIEAIGQELKTYVATDHVEKKIPAEDLIRVTKPITLATAKAVAAGNSGRQEDVIVAANMGRKAISDLLRTCKGAAANADSAELQQQVLDSGRLCSIAYKELLEQVGQVIQKQTPDGKQRLLLLSKKVAQSVTELVHAAEILKGNDWVDPNDPTAIAEAELLAAATQIEAAARKLTELQPRREAKSVDTNLNFDEQILEAAKSIASATAALVKAASAAQRELVAQGKLSSFRNDGDDNSQWSEGLISAARLVAAATYSLCEAANAMVHGEGSEEKLISSAKAVASSTAQLLVACKVKADPDSAAMRRLQTAGNAVKRATEALVRAAQQLKEGWMYEEYSTSTTVSQRMVGGLAQVIMAQEEILIKERELETARRRLENIRRAKYRSEDEDESAGSSF